MLTSTQNAKIKYIHALKSMGKARKKNREFVVEGKKMLVECPKNALVEIFMTEEFFIKESEYVKQLSIPYHLVHENVFKYISTSVTPQGVLGVIKQRHLLLEDILLPKEPLIVALENLQDPGNIGAIFRTCDAAKVDAIMLSSGSVDMYNSKVVRATMGAIFRVPVITNCCLDKVVNELKAKGIAIYAAHLEGATMHYEVNMTTGTCLLIGNEGNGLSKEMTDLADKNIKIPMFGETESLNASVAASILVYEGVRQRMTK